MTLKSGRQEMHVILKKTQVLSPEFLMRKMGLEPTQAQCLQDP